MVLLLAKPSVITPQEYKFVVSLFVLIGTGVQKVSFACRIDELFVTVAARSNGDFWSRFLIKVKRHN